MAAFLSIFVVITSGYLIIKKYNTHAILFIAGVLMLVLSNFLVDDLNFLPKGVKSSNSFLIDCFLLIEKTFSSTLAKLGLIIMAAGGYSKYMNYIGASDAMVKVATKPLSYIKSPYVMLALAYIVGQILNIFIPSAAGLAMLLLVAMYPALVGAGCNPAATAAVLATTGCLDLGPASGNSNKAAEIISNANAAVGAETSIDAASYFVQYQIPASVLTILVIAVLHFFTQRYFDKQDAKKGITHELKSVDSDEAKKAPIWFAILPVIPLVLLLVFSKFAISSIKIGVVSAMFIGIFISMVAYLTYHRNIRDVLDSLKIYFKAMGDIFASIVTLIIAANVFVTGLLATGAIDALLDKANGLGFGYLAMVITLIAIIGLVSFLSGSGNAAFFSLSNIAPSVAVSSSVPVALIVTPMQLSAGLFRSFSPVAGVVLACAGVAGISPIELVKRTFIPMLGGVVAMVASTVIFVS